MPHALVTGSAGFIGYHLCRRLLAEGWEVTGLDAMTPYYDPALKRARHARLAGPGFRAVEGRLEAPGLVAGLMAETRPGLVVHLAAQAGVRHSLEQPRSYLAANVDGTFELLDAARAHPPTHLLLASTSSVYGGNTRRPYAETDPTDTPLSLYAATKRATEAMAHVTAHLHGVPVTAFRFFTVYGPWGRPDMALFRFTRAILAGEPVDIFGQGDMKRDFTYADDLVEAVVRLIPVVPGTDAIEGDSLSPVAPFRIVNIAGGTPAGVLDLLAAVEAATGRTARRNLMPMQPGDVRETLADPRLLERLTAYRPSTPLAEGVAAFVEWFREWSPNLR